MVGWGGDEHTEMNKGDVVLCRHTGWSPSMALTADTAQLKIKASLARSNQSPARIITT